MAEAFLSQLLLVENRVQNDDSQCCICGHDYGSLRPDSGTIECQIRLPCNHSIGSGCISIVSTLPLSIPNQSFKRKLPTPKWCSGSHLQVAPRTHALSAAETSSQRSQDHMAKMTKTTWTNCPNFCTRLFVWFLTSMFSYHCCSYTFYYVLI